jgi:hypothetical protein
MLGRSEGDAMRVLVVGSMPVSVGDATEELQRAGHEVLRCHDDAGPAFPCAALDGEEGCPLEGVPVDVVLDVHDARTGAPSAYEDGAACGVRQHIPLVVVADGKHPYRRWATREVSRDADVVKACEAAAAAPLAEHGEIAARVARESMERAGVDPAGVTATVHRVGGSLKVLLTLPPSHSESIESMVAARVVTHLRGYDKSARGVDVALL